jgi:phospholipid/cholesterol/gamma-HCH transport system substrate-binding protein
MKNTLETRLGMFVALAMIAAFFILEIIGAQNFLQPGYHLRAQFSNIQDLKPGDAVKMAGVPVGRVEKIKLVENKVEVMLKLNKDTMVRTDSKATIKFTGLMGQYYVAIDFGGPNSPRMEDKQLLQTVEQPDLNAIMAKLDDVASGVQNLTKSFSGEKIDNILGPFISFMNDNNPKFRAIFANLQTISTQIAEGKGTVGRLINEDTLYTTAQTTLSNAQDAVGEIKGAVTQARSVLDQVNAGQGTFGKLVKDDTLYRDAAATMKNVREMTDKMNSGQGTIGKLVNDDEFLKNAKLSLQKLDKATESLEDSGPLSLIGQIITTLF